ncbi:CDP-diacylglycerol--glycerol-3-phosphate 3-phosphatidyltransferase [Agathobaculum sp.]|uniref:CDP-diacylglycerol--glycerol-3-phosphate 3-phosphatidyltransferase n=1 Tax=Agathobaculum sp. TaxID=2048138 RepID=UPI0027B880BD|nr:CDP-diacylglycerol--glycerol-3-phosphate 3-phosphatidyltransferase [Agathobaculum sp.]
MTTANKITLTRICMIPFFLYFASQPMLVFDQEAWQNSFQIETFFPTASVVALVLFCVASFTDFLDGYVARKYNQVTDFGKFVDPLADKLLVTSALVLFAEQGALAGWMVCVIIARELIITSLRVVAANKGRVLAATWTGKVKTCVQIGGIIVIYLYYIFIGAVGSGAFDSMTVSSDGSFSATSTVMFLTGTDGYPTFVYFVGWMITLVTIYSGFDYLRKNWDIIKDGAVKEK